MDLKKEISAYTPYNEQEAAAKEQILAYLEKEAALLTRENTHAHFTASAWVLNPTHTKVAMVYHHIYQSWSWVGGHADGEADLLKVAIKEAKEETGLKEIKPVHSHIYSIEVLPVAEHVKKGKIVPAHLHLNLTYLLEALEEELTVNPAENSAVAWMAFDEAVEKSTEAEMKAIYRKLNEKLATLFS
ncbi:NUDIX hydrolase [Jeotgalibaca caeni]|uniref:NUDIX hydrolase n=1 Tax=Jeotgalibaca caeni TaxID=3028623 RepID=UPI00237ED0EC|nr:NUDIX hydrolase [Jeotgalibaca caeni]MDE1548880.1 NUDIX hydrolase [Jeotgalibaca caeni]